jgi:hypothetical protein
MTTTTTFRLFNASENTFVRREVRALNFVAAGHGGYGGHYANVGKISERRVGA